MANYRKYAENLIGNWNTDQYEPQRAVAKETYQTNWDKLQNDFNNYVTNLKRNLDVARTGYYDELSAADEASALRTNAAMESLANRGLLNSGLAGRYSASDTTAKGKQVNDALDKIVNTNTSYAGTLSSLVDSMADDENKLNAQLAATLGGLTGKEAAAKQGYQTLAAGIASSAQGRAIARAASASARKASSKKDEWERKVRISDTLGSDKLTDNQKVRYLTNYLDVPVDKAEAAVKAYKDNAAYNDNLLRIQKAEQKAARAAQGVNNRTVVMQDNPLYEYVNQIRDRYGNLGAADISRAEANPYVQAADRPAVTLNTTNYDNAMRTLDRLRNEQSNLTYTDLYNLLYGGR